jgi:hypothetical protein
MGKAGEQVGAYLNSFFSEVREIVYRAVIEESSRSEDLDYGFNKTSVFDLKLWAQVFQRISLWLSF